MQEYHQKVIGTAVLSDLVWVLGDANDSLKECYAYKQVVMIGDGATDMQARPPADAFIGYGGVAVREKVKQGADWFVYSFDDLLKAIR